MKLFVRSAVIMVILVAVAVWGVMAAFDARVPPKVEKRAEPTLSVRTIQLQRQEYRPSLFLIGRVEARDYATLNASIEANILNIRVREGDTFPKGKQLINVDQRELQYTIAGQQAAVDELNAQYASLQRNRIADTQRLSEVSRLLELTQKDYERSQQLFEKQVLPAKQLEQSEQALLSRQLEFTVMQNQVADYDTQQLRLNAQINATNAQQEQTELLLERAQYSAPFAGRVAKVHTAIGARPARGAPLLSIFNPSHLRLRVAVAQRYAAAIKSGKVQAIINSNGNSLTLAYVGLEPQVEAGNSSIDTFFALPRGDWVLGAVHDVMLELTPVNSAAVPIDAIYNDEYIYRLDAESRAEAVACQRIGLARSDAENLQVLVTCPTLQEGDRVVIDQLPNLLNGVLLKVINSNE